VSEVSALISPFSDLQNNGDTIRRNHDECPPRDCLSLISSSPQNSEPVLQEGSTAHKREGVKVAENEKTPSTVFSQPIGPVPTEVAILNDGGHGTKNDFPGTLALALQDPNPKTKGKDLASSKKLAVKTQSSIPIATRLSEAQRDARKVEVHDDVASSSSAQVRELRPNQPKSSVTAKAPVVATCNGKPAVHK